MQILHPPSVQFKLYQGEVFQYKPGASDHRSVLLRVSCRPGALGGAMSTPAGGAAASEATGAADPPTDREVVALLRERVPKFRDLPPQQRLLSADLKLELQRHKGGAACLPEKFRRKVPAGHEHLIVGAPTAALFAYRQD